MELISFLKKSYISGGVAVACAVCAMLFLKESPKDVGFEQDFSLTQKKDNGCHKEKSSKSDPFNWKDLLHSPLLRLVSVGYFVVFACRTSVTDWGQMYFIEDLGQSPFIGILVYYVQRSICIFKINLITFR